MPYLSTISFWAEIKSFFWRNQKILLCHWRHGLY